MGTHDSHELFFVAGGGPSSRILSSVRVDPAQDPPLGTLTRLFGSRGDDELHDFDVSSDGQRILFTHAADGGEGSARHLVLVQNWASGIEGESRR